MEEKTRFIIIALLVGILAISIIVNLQTYSSKQAIEREKDVLSQENDSLTKKITELKQNIDALNSNLKKISEDKEEIQKQREQVQAQYEQIQKQYELVAKERDGLLEKLRAEPALVKEQKEPPPASSSAYWVQILKAKSELELQLENLRSELRAQQIENEQLQKEKGIIDLDVDGMLREKKDLEQRFNYMAYELLKEKNLGLGMQEDLKAIKAENSDLRQQLKSLSRYKIHLEKKLVKLEDERTGLERRFDEMSILLENRLSQIEDFKEQVGVVRSGGEAELLKPKKESIELPPIVVRPQAEFALSQKEKEEEEAFGGAAVGRVLAVNAENNFVVINIGEDAGIKAGETLQVYREGVPIATVEVIQARRKLAACDIKREVTSIKVGDTVR